MKENKKDTRRQFLRNASLAILSVGALPQLLKANESKGTPNKKSLANCELSTQDAYGQGPFYTENAPTISDNMLADESEAGQRIIISGRVYDVGCEEVIPNTIIDVWHADHTGAYDNNTYNLRGVTTTNDQGFYIFETIRPGWYQNGATYRPSHIHFKITPPGFDPLITQLYFEGDPYIEGDFAASKTTGDFNALNRIIPLTDNGAGVLEGTWDIVIDGDGIELGMEDLRQDKGIIYGISPNPFANQIEINYGVFQRSKVSLSVFDLRGNKVADLEEQILSPQKYSARWTPDSSLSNGHYFVALKINDLQVHYQKIVRHK